MRYFPAKVIGAAGAALLLALGLLAPACHKPEPPEPEAVALPAQLKSYVLFQPGSYWIYQDSASHQRDSVWVVSTDTSVVRVLMSRSNIVDFKYEKFKMRTRSSQGGPDLIYSDERYCALPIQEDVTNIGPCWAITRGLSLPNSTADVGGALVFPYSIPRDLYRPGYYVFGELVPYWHSQPITIAGRSYPDVMEVSVYADASEDGWRTHYYWAPHLGIVQQRVWVRDPQRHVPHTRVLVRSHIVQ